MKISEVMGSDQGSEKKVTAVKGNKAELKDPNKPGVTTTVDLSKADVDTDEKGTTINTQQSGVGKAAIKPGQKVHMK